MQLISFLPVIGDSGFDDSFRHLGTKTDIFLCPLFRKNSTAIAIPLHENRSLLPWLIATLLPSITTWCKQSSLFDKLVPDEDFTLPLPPYSRTCGECPAGETILRLMIKTWPGWIKPSTASPGSWSPICSLPRSQILVQTAMKTN